MWSNEDLLWLRKSYPGLKPTTPGVIEGTISFRMLHYAKENHVNPNQTFVTQGLLDGGVYISDSYQIRLEWLKNGCYPSALETGGRIDAIGKKFKKSVADTHRNTDGKDSLCVADPMELLTEFIEKFNLKSYIEGFLVPYLFGQSHYAKTKIWLWGELSHGYWGHLEWLGRKKEFALIDIKGVVMHIVDEIGVERTVSLFSKRCRSHHPCPCGSAKQTRFCHPDIKDAISRIRGELSRHAFTIEGLLRRH